MKNSAIGVTLLLVLALGFLALGSGAAAPSKIDLDWPQWRGPGRDGISPQTGLVREWSGGGPDIVWRVKVGSGFSGVSIADGKLYTLWDEDESQFLVCLDATTGKELWRQRLGAAFTHHYGDGPRSTPLVDENLVFSIGTDGLLLAADRKSGRPKWQHDLVKEYKALLPTYGFSTSPLVVGDKLIVEAGGEGATWIALEKKTGKLAWTAASDRPSYSSPLEVTMDGVSQVVFWSAHGLHAVSTDAGKVLWNYTWETFCPVTGDPLNTATPIFISPDRIFISSSAGAAVVRIARADDPASANESFTVETLWKSQQMRNDVSTSLLLDGHIYGFDGGILKSLDARTGEVMWKARGFQRGSLIAADGTLIVLGEQGNLALVDASPNAFVQRATAQVMGGRNWTTPSLAGGRLYLRNQKELVCIDLRG